MMSSALAVAEASEQCAARRARVRVLDEDKYVSSLETIIARDFYPDVEKLRAQREYLEAEETGDLQLMRHIALRFSSQQDTAGRDARRDTDTRPNVTPASFETPEAGSRVRTPRGREGLRGGVQGERGSAAGVGEGLGGEGVVGEGEGVGEGEAEELPRLDAFLQRHTSEDNASFGTIMALTEDRLRHKHAWLMEAERHHKQKRAEALCVPSAETQAHESHQAGLDTWEYSAKNSLMYYPEAVSVQDVDFVQPREITHRNTRLHGNPHSRSLNRSSLQQAAAYQAQFRLGKIGVDGREITQESPRVGGFGYVGTPSPAPGVSESPLMTWGEVEGSPFRLDGADTPHLDRTPAPAFKMPGPTRRETLGHRMANEAALRHRVRKQEALRRVTESLVSPSPRPFGGALSPALQKLVQKTSTSSSAFTDPSLRASYTPSPRGGGTGAPRQGGGAPDTPTIAGNSPSLSTGKRRSSAAGAKRKLTPVSITDNLMSLPGRKRAADFF